MPNHLSPETTKRIRALCRQISVAHNLDDASRRKLYSQMETKLLGFMSGVEKLSEENALLLVQEHFGSPENLKSLLQEVHAVETHLSLARRIGAVLAVSLGVGFVTSLLSLIFVVISVNLSTEYAHSRSTGSSIIMMATTLFGILLLWGILLYWKKRMAQGEVLWFHRMRWFLFPGFMILLFLLDTAVPFLNYNNFLHLVRSPSPVTITPGMTDRTAAQQLAVIEVFKLYPSDLWMTMRMPENRDLAVDQLILLIASCLAWLWWCDVPPRRFRFLLIAAASWFVYDYFLQNVQPKHELVFDNAARHFTTSIHHPTHDPEILPPGMILFAGLVLVLLFLYLVVRRGADSRKAAVAKTYD